MQLQQISTYIDLLLRWNARINLTAIRNPEEIVTRHFGESFFLARHLFPETSVGRTLLSDPPLPNPSDSATHPTALSAKSGEVQSKEVHVLDIGSGAGFPGLPLKIWAPTISLTLVESNQKKATFLREVVRALTLTNVNVSTARAETLTSSANIVTLRAVEHFDTILPIAARQVNPSGRLALLIASSQLPSLQNLSAAFRLEDPIPVPQSQSRILSIMVR